MSEYKTYKGVTVDIDAIRRENEHSIAIGNQNVNARGDTIHRNTIVKTVTQTANESHNVVKTISQTSLKDPIENDLPLDSSIKREMKPKAVERKIREKELPNGDIVTE